MAIKYKIGITTIDRTTQARGLDTEKRKDEKRHNYIAQTLDKFWNIGSLIEAPRYNCKVKIFESGSPSTDYITKVLPKYPLIEYEGSDHRISLVQNSHKALKWAAEDSDYAILMQDDLSFVNDALRQILIWVNHAPKDADLLTLWNPYISKKEDYVKIAPKDFWASVFLIFKSDQAKDFIEFSNRAFPDKEWGHDMIVKSWANKNKKIIYANSEGLIDHIGLFSSVARREERRNNQFKNNDTN